MTRVYGYAIKNSGLIVEVNRQHLHVCVKEPRVKIRSPQGSGACRVSYKTGEPTLGWKEGSGAIPE